jgi:hypothetical protein
MAYSDVGRYVGHLDDGPRAMARCISRTTLFMIRLIKQKPRGSSPDFTVTVAKRGFYYSNTTPACPICTETGTSGAVCVCHAERETARRGSRPENEPLARGAIGRPPRA